MILRSVGRQHWEAIPNISGTSDGIMDALVNEINAKLQLLELKRSKSQAVTAKPNVETVVRHRDNLKSLAKEVHEHKFKIEQAKLSKGENLDDVSTWSVEIEEKLEAVDTEIANLGKWLDEAKHQASLAAKQSKEALLAKERQQQLEFERAQHELKFE